MANNLYFSFSKIHAVLEMIIEILWVKISHQIKNFSISGDAVYEFDSIEWLTLNCKQ